MKYRLNTEHLGRKIAYFLFLQFEDQAIMDTSLKG